MSRYRSASPVREPLLAAKGRLPPLPSPHVPRPRVVTALLTALQTHRLVVLAAGALTGKTTVLAEAARDAEIGRVCWYSIDEIDATPRMLLEGLARATSGAIPRGDETDLLGTIIGALDGGTARTILLLDDLHRSPAAIAVLDRLLRYLPPCAHVVLSTWPDHAPLPPLYRWLEDQQQVACLDSAALRLDARERARFRAAKAHAGGAWAVEYRPGGRPAIVDGLRHGVLPLLDAEVRPLIALLAVLPSATPALLSAALTLPEAEVTRQLTALRDETILLEQLDTTHYRLSETARQAALGQHDETALAAMRRDAARALEPHDPAQAAYLFAQAGCVERAGAVVRRLSWWAWEQRGALALALETLLPAASLRQVPALGLILAYRRLVEQGAPAAHALARAIRPVEPIDAIQRLLLLSYCCAARQRPWSLERCVVKLEALAGQCAGTSSLHTHAYGLLALGIARGLAGRHGDAAKALRSCLEVLILDGATDAHTSALRLSAVRALAVAERRQGHLAEAERLYTEAEDQARTDGFHYVQLELMNNRAVLLQQRGAHAESAEVLRAALASPWSAERGLRPLLSASLADALAALGDRAGAARTLHAALDDMQSCDSHGLLGHVHAMRAVLLAEDGQVAAATIEIAAGAPPKHAATLLARALLLDPLSAGARPALHHALEAAGVDVPMRAQVRAHLARVCAAQGDRRQARRWATAVVHDPTYPLTPREMAILGPRTYRVRPGLSQGAPTRSAAPSVPSITVRFFGPPILSVDGEPVGNVWWARSKGRELLWYALAHGTAGFTREEACADLFPESDAVAASRSLRNLLYEIRRLLRAHCGVEALRAGPDGRFRLMPQDLSSAWEADTRTLQEWLAHLRAGAADAVGNVPGLLVGEYLAGLHADWTRPFRQYWQREAIHALDLCATHYERAGRATEAVACLRREMDFCPDDPIVIRRLLVLYHALSDLGGLRATYLMHCRALDEDIEGAPDPELVTLYETLTHDSTEATP